MPGIGSRPYSKLDQLGGKTRERRTAEKLLARYHGEKGPEAKRREQKSRRVFLAERKVKIEVKALDGWHCRWPECDIPLTMPMWGVIEASHYAAEGMGGDPNLVRCTLENLLSLCHWHHRGPKGVDQSGLARYEPLNPTLGTRGPVAFYLRDPETGREFLVGITEPPAIRVDRPDGYIDSDD
jgi:hypothetical protein